jgi:predicted DNA-binding WGR domain protein
MYRVAQFLMESGMLVIPPSVEHANLVLRSLKNDFGVDSVNHPIFQQFLTKQEGASNKFHLFVVFKHQGEFIGANAYGRIGYNAKSIEIARSKNENQVLSAVKKKISSKISGGYVLH